MRGGFGEIPMNCIHNLQTHIELYIQFSKRTIY